MSFNLEDQLFDDNESQFFNYLDEQDALNRDIPTPESTDQSSSDQSDQSLDQILEEVNKNPIPQFDENPPEEGQSSTADIATGANSAPPPILIDLTQEDQQSVAADLLIVESHQLESSSGSGTESVEGSSSADDIVVLLHKEKGQEKASQTSPQPFDITNHINPSKLPNWINLCGRVEEKEKQKKQQSQPKNKKKREQQKDPNDPKQHSLSTGKRGKYQNPSSSHNKVFGNPTRGIQQRQTNFGQGFAVEEPYFGFVPNFPPPDFVTGSGWIEPNQFNQFNQFNQPNQFNQFNQFNPNVNNQQFLRSAQSNHLQQEPNRQLQPRAPAEGFQYLQETSQVSVPTVVQPTTNPTSNSSSTSAFPPLATVQFQNNHPINFIEYNPPQASAPTLPNRAVLPQPLTNSHQSREIFVGLSPGQFLRISPIQFSPPLSPHLQSSQTGPVNPDPAEQLPNSSQENQNQTAESSNHNGTDPRDTNRRSPRPTNIPKESVTTYNVSYFETIGDNFSGFNNTLSPHSPIRSIKGIQIDFEVQVSEFYNKATGKLITPTKVQPRFSSWNEAIMSLTPITPSKRPKPGKLDIPSEINNFSKLAEKKTSGQMFFGDDFMDLLRSSG